MHGLNLYDYSARYYDATIGRFTTVDPLAEKYYSISPYAYVANNPIKFIDKDGRSFDFPPVGGSPADYQRMAASKYIDNTIRRNASTIQRNAIKEVALSSDLNDATVITTAITRRGNAINIDGTPAGGVDMGFTALGAVIPFVSGSAVKGFFKSIGNAFGIGTEKVTQTSRAARRQAMRDLGIPTSQSLHQDKFTKSQDRVFLTRDKDYTVQDAKNDVSHQGEPHWEAGPTKKDPNTSDGLNRSGSNNKPQMGKPKSKAYYDEQ